MASIAVLGVGRIGGEIAFLSSALGLADDLIVYDTATPFLRSQVADLSHMGLEIPISTDWRRVKDADVCVFSAGLPRNADVKTRADLLQANLPVAIECSQAIRNFSGILITVTNPMDANNYVLCKKNGLEPERCIGFGGQLDSARFCLAAKARGLMGEFFVVGDHGEYQVPLFSRLDQPVALPVREEILGNLRGASMEIIKGKGGTVFGPAYHIAELIRTVVENRRATLTCSCVLDGEYGLSGCSLGVPAVIGREGVSEILDWKMDDWEKSHFTDAGTFVAGLCRQSGV
ncbi:MAG: lactate dehydrogenase [Methanolinea sp.]|nr:lactate dehydrogenase [Methanolinea sp.]